MSRPKSQKKKEKSERVYTHIPTEDIPYAKEEFTKFIDRDYDNEEQED